MRSSLFPKAVLPEIQSANLRSAIQRDSASLFKFRSLRKPIKVLAFVLVFRNSSNRYFGELNLALIYVVCEKF